MRNNIKRYQFKTNLALGFEIVSLKDLYATNKKILTTPHRTDFYHIIWFKNEKFIYLIDFEPVEIDSDTILFLSKHKVQRFDDKKNIEGLAILFTDNFFCKTAEQTQYLHRIPLFNNAISLSTLKIKEDKTLKDIIEMMEKELLKTADAFQPDLLRNLLYNFLLESEREIIKQGFTEPEKDANFNHVLLFKDILEENYAKFKQVRSYAEKMFITEKRLNQATSKMLGKSPKQLIDERVIIEAKRLLVYTDKSVKEIGYNLGFKEPTNFIKYFRRHNHQTPIEFRESFVIG